MLTGALSLLLQSVNIIKKLPYICLSPCWLLLVTSNNQFVEYACKSVCISSLQSVVPDRFLVWPTPFVGFQLLVMMIRPEISHPTDLLKKIGVPCHSGQCLNLQTICNYY